MHTLFFREHNRVASSLSYLNAHWDQERLFQESRKIVVAEWQHIVFTEYLPKILGPSGMSILGDYHGYDPNVNPTIANAFATAAYRFGHSQIQPMFERLGAGYLPHASGPLLLRDAFFAPFRLLEEGGVDPLLRGLLASGAKKRSPSSGLNSNLTEALFAQVHEVALDLAALNIQRGRDHGLPSYLAWREFCGLETTDPLADIGNDTVKQLLMELYEDMGDIDLWVGGLLETLEEGAQLGPTFNCLIAGQFARLRDGDRFWYERVGQFSPDQLLQLKQASLSRIICDNADSISRVPRDALLLQEVSEFTNCSDLPSVNLDLWMDCQAESGPRDRRSVLLEAVAEEVMQLRAAVTHLQNNAASCVVNGVTYGSGATWTMGLCSHCSCQMGRVSCFDRNC
jgi:peroxidase